MKYLAINTNDAYVIIQDKDLIDKILEGKGFLVVDKVYSQDYLNSNYTETDFRKLDFKIIDEKEITFKTDTPKESKVVVKENYIANLQKENSKLFAENQKLRSMRMDESLTEESALLSK